MDAETVLSLIGESGALDVDKLVVDITDKLIQLYKNNKLFEPEFQQKLPFLSNIISSVNAKDALKVSLDNVLTIIRALAMPVLQKINPLYDSREDSMSTVVQMAALLVLCLNQTPVPNSMWVLQQCLRSMRYHIRESAHVTNYADHSRENILDIHCSLEILHCYAGTMDEKSESQEMNQRMDQVMDDLFIECLNTVSEFSNKTVVALAQLCITKLLKKDPDKLLYRLTLTWEVIQRIWKENKNSDKLLMILCALSNHFFPVSGTHCGIDLRAGKESGKFWQILQNGISHKNPLTRKRAMYLLKRITDICGTVGADVGSQPSRVKTNAESKEVSGVFWWRKSEQQQLCKIWEDFVMLIETLEEKQVHVIKPLLPRLQSLIQASQYDQKNLSFLHTSWLVAVVRRALMHESVFIVRWITELVLNLDLDLCPLLHQGQDNYLSSEFLLSIQEPKLYIREPGTPLGSTPGSGASVSVFFTNCWKQLENNTARSAFFQQVIQTIITNTWGPVPLLFIYQALSQLPVSPLFNKEGIASLKKTLSVNLTTWNPYMRGAVHHFCGRVFINLIDTASVKPGDFAYVLCMFEREESLQRVSVLWGEITSWLKDVAESEKTKWSRDAIQKYLHKAISDILQMESGQDVAYSFSETEVMQTVRMLLLCVDADIIPVKRDPSSKDLSLDHYLNLLTEVINSVPSRPYLPPLKAEKAVETVISLIKEMGQINGTGSDALSSVVRSMLDGCYESLYVFAKQRLLNGWKNEEDLASIKLLYMAIGLVCGRSCDSHVISQMEKLVDACISLLKEYKAPEEVTMAIQIKRLAASRLLSSVCHTDAPAGVVNMIMGYVPDIDMSINFAKPLADIRRKTTTVAGVTPSSASDLLGISQGETMLPVMRCICHILQQALSTKPESHNEIVNCLSVCWSSLQEMRKATFFWDTLQAFIDISFQPELLKLPPESEISKWLMQCAEKLFDFGSEKSGVVNMVMSRLYSIWNHEETLIDAENYLHLMVSACMFGTIYKKQDRQILDVHCYLRTLGDTLSVNQLKPWSPRDMMVRVDAVNFLCRLKPDNPAHVKFVVSLHKELRDKYRELVAIPTGQTFSNSQVHRQKNRILQFMVLLLPFITGSESEVLWDFTWDLLMQEMQPSVRHYLEWIVMYLAYRYIHLAEKLWTLFDQMTEKRTMSLCSMFCVLSHIGPHLDHKFRVTYYATTLYKVIPWCMAHHFNTRVHAQATLVKLWQQCEQLNLQEVLNSHNVIKPCFDFFKEINNSTKNVWRLLENYFFQVFDPKRDFTIDTIYHTLPRLGILHDDEWIDTYRFKQTEEMWGKSGSFITLENGTDDLKKSTPGPWRFKGIDETEEDEEEGGNGNSNVQKKIMPWRHTDPDEEALEQLEYTNRIKERGGQDGLILVTSLIEKIPNLGGLCRTSEIFGVSQFVVRKLSYIDDKMFQSLSVTAEKWIPVLEVYHERLPEYLEEKKLEGYTLIGVEQTANSVSMTEFNFPKKSLLLLGNEKEGIPVELINLLDVCVEIPQQGVIRSLNVHVSGALMVWEYRRQQLVNTKDG
ncbi:hypothetical protein FSP39_020941 [Pinctada imbricata]|uniref:tRNA (guanosine(18)-2'-O)-methyltransferase TARBP1 n=1 Tax=Pinctada imbricata TaxID=66713 RepID=A0AA88Y121_PINIB|nr:hypothetical protein FSP39_020941 [Pinctada imbricata]